MSFKYQAVKIAENQWLLDKGVTIPILVFMNDKLYDLSEEGMWQQATWATTIPTVKKIIMTADGHIGAGVPIGIVIATENYIAPCAAGYDISCGMISLKTNLKVSDIADKVKRRAWINAIEARIATGPGGYSDKKTKQFNFYLKNGFIRNSELEEFIYLI
jgi:tRNA-splicing ligase RtcB (3'-phosphate/5'-hydroxy nucleic acid ligase)